MASSFTTIGVELQRAAEEAVNVPDETMLRAIGEQAITIIALRTKAGIDADHKPFKNYVRGYADHRARRGLRVMPPDLAVTGRMLGAMVAVPERNEVSIEFRSPEDALKAAANADPKKHPDRKRDFFDLRQEDEIEVIESMVLDAIEARWGRG